MIKKVETIKNYGIFRDFHWISSIPEFKTINLFYGLNGAGKSTFSTIFDDIKNKEQRYFHGEFKLSDDIVGSIDSHNLDNYDYNLYVFNTHFIENNIGEFKSLKGIVYISEENKIAKSELEQLQKDYLLLCRKFDETDRKYNEINKKHDNALIRAAKAIKDTFISIGGYGKKYSNYNKATFMQSVEKYKAYLSEKHDTKIVIKQVDELKQQLKDVVKPIINCSVPSFDSTNLIETINRISTLLSTSISQSLKESIGDSIYVWLEEGYRIHKNGDNVCKYCGNIISKERQAALDAIFSGEINKVTDKLLKEKLYLETHKLNELPIYESNFYSSQKEVIQTLNNYRNIRIIFNSFIDELIEKVNNKLKNPFDPILITSSLDERIKDLPEILSSIADAVNEANTITSNFIQKQQEAIDSIEKLLVYYNYVQQNISSIRIELNKAAKTHLDAKTEKELNEKERNRLENELRDVIKAGTEFNELLSKFLGRKELELKYDDITKGYLVIRKESGLNAEFLSEGEKTAIAFIYFLTKVHENGNAISDSVIVFDDPISSFDSNHLYNAYSFISTYFSNCKQLFILTHNFNFFKLVRKKFCKTAEMYLIDGCYCTIDGTRKRSATILSLPKSIKQASSEYTYLFDKAYSFYQKYSSGENTDVIQFDDYMQMSNICRKIIESFASFKVQNVNDLSQKIERLYKCNHHDGYNLTNEEKTEAEQIYRFVNAFSHESQFEETDDTDILFGELGDIVGKVLKLIMRTDIDHYSAMVASIT